jgi:putative PIN family toxin of toxin-antitoxin system
VKVFFDTNVLVADALLGKTAQRLVQATIAARWRIRVSKYVLIELRRVLVEGLGYPASFADRACNRLAAQARMVPERFSRHRVPADPNDSPILRAALGSGVDYLVTNDTDLLVLDPYEGLRIVSMSEYLQILVNEGLVSD